MGIRILHLADLHLGAAPSYLGERAAVRAEDFNQAFRRAMAVASEPSRRIDIVILAGDLFESHRPSSALVGMVRGAISRLRASGVPTVIVPGTHDAWDYPDSTYRSGAFSEAILLTDPAVGEPRTIDIRGTPVHLYGMGYDAARSAPPFDQFRRTPAEGLHIAVIHGTIVESGHWLGRDRDIPLRPDELANTGMDYVALGHFHSFRRYRFGDVVATYPGTLEGRTFAELGDRYLVIVEFDAGTVTNKKVKFNRRTLEVQEVNLGTQGIAGNEDLARVIETAASEDTLLRVVLRGTADFVPDLDYLRGRLGDRFFHLEIQDRSQIFGSPATAVLAEEPTVRGIFIRNMLARIEQAGGRDREVAELALKLGIHYLGAAAELDAEEEVEG